MIVEGQTGRRVDEFSLADADVLALVELARSHCLVDTTERMREALSDSTSVDRGTARKVCAEITNLIRAGAVLRGLPRSTALSDDQLRELAALAEDHGQIHVARMAARAVGSQRSSYRGALAAISCLMSAAYAERPRPRRVEVRLTGAELAEAVVEYAARRGVTVRGVREVVVEVGAHDSSRTVALDDGSVSAVVYVSSGGTVADRRSDAARSSSVVGATKT